MKRFLTIIGLFLLLSGMAYAKESQFDKSRDDLIKALPTTELGRCSEVLVPLYDIETVEFLQFLDENFKNKSSNSSLTNIAIVRYSKYKKTLNEYYESLNPQATGSLQQGVEFQTYLKCGGITESYISAGKTKLLEHVKNSSYQKRTTMMVEKYQNIGDRLRELNMSIAEMSAFFGTFENKLPGFLRKCISK